MEAFLKKITPWLPVAIAAGYFMFLVMSWKKYITLTDTFEAKFEKIVKAEGLGEKKDEL